MTLKNHTKDLHKEIEQTPFAQTLIKGTVSVQTYYTYLSYYKKLYELLETHTDLYKPIESVKRYPAIIKDLNELNFTYEPITDLSVLSYMDYLTSIKDIKKLKSHIYVRYMGDINGGQILKQRLSYLPTNLYDFDNIESLKLKLKDFFIDADENEARKAFVYNISIYRNLGTIDYD